MLGIDIGCGAIKLAAMHRGRRGWRLQAYAVQNLPAGANAGAVTDPVALRGTLIAALGKLGVRLRDAAVALNSAEAVTRTIRLEAGLTDQDIENRIAVEAAEHLPFALADASLDFCRLPANDDVNAAGQDVLLVACRRDCVQQRVRLLTELGIRPAIVDLDALALRRIAGETSLTATQVMLDLGASGFRLHAFAGGRLLYSRAHHRVLSAECRQASVQDAGQESVQESESVSGLIQEIKRAIQLFLISTACKEPVSIVVAGGLAPSPGLVSGISTVCGRPVRLIRPPSEVMPHGRVDLSQWRAMAPQLSLACALAMRSG